MSDENGPTTTEANLPNLTETAITLKTGIPTQIQRSFWKACGRVLAGAAEIPASWLEGKALLIKTRSQVEADKLVTHQRAWEIIETESAKKAAELFKNEDLQTRALSYHAKEIFREQENRESVLAITADELNRQSAMPEPHADIDDDWLTSLLAEASKRSNQEIQGLFGRILAGEIQNPGTFSFGTIQSLSRLTQTTAKNFQAACNLSSNLFGTIKIVATPFGTAGDNSLAPFGLSYDLLIGLVEDGLLRPDFNEYVQISSIAYEHGLPFSSGSSTIRLVYEPVIDKNLPPHIHLVGPTFTKIGTELRSIVTMQPSPEEYLSGFARWLAPQHINLNLLSSSSQLEGQSIWKAIKPNLN